MRLHVFEYGRFRWRADGIRCRVYRRASRSRVRAALRALCTTGAS